MNFFAHPVDLIGNARACPLFVDEDLRLGKVGLGLPGKVHNVLNGKIHFEACALQKFNAH